jgi:hypothetical protein
VLEGFIQSIGKAASLGFTGTTGVLSQYYGQHHGTSPSRENAIEDVSIVNR